MTARETVLDYDEEVITIGPVAALDCAPPAAEQPGAAEQAAAVRATETSIRGANSRVTTVAGERLGAGGQSSADEQRGVDEQLEVGVGEQPLPAPAARKVVLCLALVGVLLIIAYILNYRGII